MNSPQKDDPGEHNAPPQKGHNAEFESLRDEQQLSLFAEFWWFLRDNKKWWLTPILLVLAGVGILVALAATGVAPFIYPFH